MALLSFPHVRMAGVAAAVPKEIEENCTLKVFGNDDPQKFIATTGVERRRIARSGIICSDLCFEATERLLTELNWEKSSIDCLIFVSQTPDYILPATSCILQKRLGLPMSCMTLDISLGCSGWVHGLSVLAALVSGGTIQRALLLVGDSLSLLHSRQDKSSWPLFGDAGTACALEYSMNYPNMDFVMNTDGEGYKAIMVRDGGFRHPFSTQSLDYEEIEPGVILNKVNSKLDGMDVFAFGISKVPRSLKMLCESFNIDMDSIDNFFFHQANLSMNEMIRKKLKLPAEKVPYSLKDFGNTSGATIPLTMVTKRATELRSQHQRNIASGFGVGLSWGTVFFETDRIVICDLIEV